MNRKSSNHLSRRNFLAASATGGAGLIIGFHLPWKSFAQNQERPTPNPFNAWIRIDHRNQVTLIVAKSEMGQGIMTALPMILADELEVPWANVHIEQAPTNPAFYDHGTGGSGSVLDSYLPLRQAAAAARQMLIAAAAQSWNVSPETCRAERAGVIHGPRKTRLDYSELVESAAKLPVPDFKKVTLKNAQDFSIVGKSIPRADIPAKVNGTAKFGIDVRVPGMLFAVVARCPTFGAKVAKFDDTKARAVSGVKQIFEIPAVGPGAFTAGGVAVVAESTWAAMQGRDALAIEWDRGANVNESSKSIRDQFVSLTEKPGKVIRHDGDVERISSAADGNKIEAVYELPFLAHATMEPMNCTVDIRSDAAEVWAPTQAPDWARGQVARISGLKPEAVTVHTTLMGGGFGRRYQADFVTEAAQVAKQAGKPVMLVWTREDDMTHDFYRPASYHKLQAMLDGDGKPQSWRHHMASTSIRAFWNPSGPKPEQQEVGGAADLPYNIPNVRVEYSNPTSHIPVAWWRSVEHSITGYVVESFLDELAVAAKKDPLDFRLQLLKGGREVPDPMWPENVHLNTDRLAKTLALAADKFGWTTPPQQGRGRGVACHFSFNTYIAQIAEVSVTNNKPRVHRVVCAVDCGRVINPDGVTAQLESGIVYGLTAALKGEITIDKGSVQQGNFDKYTMLRINEMPQVEIYIVPSEAAPTGVGEPATAVIAAAVTNAIFNATGKRVRKLPISIA
jgi:isoquinoline 1-oxidoreductase beta subunit